MQQAGAHEGFPACLACEGAAGLLEEPLDPFTAHPTSFCFRHLFRIGDGTLKVSSDRAPPGGADVAMTFEPQAPAPAPAGVVVCHDRCPTSQAQAPAVKQLSYLCQNQSSGNSIRREQSHSKPKLLTDCLKGCGSCKM